MEDKTLTYTLIFPTLPVTPSPRHPVTPSPRHRSLPISSTFQAIAVIPVDNVSMNQSFCANCNGFLLLR